MFLTNTICNCGRVVPTAPGFCILCGRNLPQKSVPESVASRPPVKKGGREETFPMEFETISHLVLA